MRYALVLTNEVTAPALIKRHPNVLLEFRLDLAPQLVDLADNSLDLKRIILTFRSKKQGGMSKLAPKKRQAFIKKLLKFRAKYIDLEYPDDISLIKTVLSAGFHVILSVHDYTHTMRQGVKRFLNNLKSLEVDFSDIILKYVGGSTDTLDAFHGWKLISKCQRKFIILSRYKNGDILRSFPSLFLQHHVYASSDPDFLISIDKLLPTDGTFIYTGLLGKTLSYSLSPLIHDLFLRNNRKNFPFANSNRNNIRGHYHLFEAKNKKRATTLISLLKTFPLKGINITFPYKKLAVKLADWCSPEVIATNSANTFVFTDKIKAYNTDITGFLRMLLEYKVPIEDACIFGSGSSARSIAYALKNKGHKVTIIYRKKSQQNFFPTKLAESVDFLHIKDFRTTDNYNIFINATPLGLDGISKPPIKLSDKTQVIIDLAYTKSGTPLVNENYAKLAFDGKQMLFHQAADSFELWTQYTINRARLYAQFLRLLEDSM